MNSSGADAKNIIAQVSSDLGIFSLLHAVGALQERVDTTLEQLGLSMAKYMTLKHLNDAACGVSLGSLADSRNCARSNITQLIDRLVVDGFVERVNHPTDRRAVFAKMTALGDERFRAATDAMQAIQDTLLGQLSAADRASFVRVLSALRGP